MITNNYLHYPLVRLCCCILNVFGASAHAKMAKRRFDGVSTERGNLYMKFDIQFPTQFQLETKQRMIDALQCNEELLAGN